MTAGASSVKGLASAVLLLFCRTALINTFLIERSTELHVVLVSARTTVSTSMSHTAVILM